MRIGCAILCLCLGWPLSGRGEDQIPATDQAETNLVVPRGAREGLVAQPASDVTNITEYLQEKFRIPARPVSETPPGSNDLATADGQVYRTVQVWKVEPDGLILRHAEGLDKVEFLQLPEEWRRKYGYDPELAAVYQRAVAVAAAEAERNQRLLREQMAPASAAPVAKDPR